MSVTSYLRTNYRLTGAKTDLYAEVVSNVIIGSVSAVAIGSGSAYIGASIGAVPSRVVFFAVSDNPIGASAGTGWIAAFGAVSISGSIAMASVFKMAYAGTFTRVLSVSACRIGYVAIIGSR